MRAREIGETPKGVQPILSVELGLLGVLVRRGDSSNRGFMQASVTYIFLDNVL